MTITLQGAVDREQPAVFFSHELHAGLFGRFRLRANTSALRTLSGKPALFATKRICAGNSWTNTADHSFTDDHGSRTEDHAAAQATM